MQDEVHQAEVFYAGPAGAHTVQLLARTLRTMWPDMSGQRLLALGYGAPYLPLWEETAALAVSARLEEATGRTTLVPAGSRDCVVSERCLPFDDFTFDRILMIHALETSQSVKQLLRGAWRVLRDEGRLLLVVPNRRGIWAFSEGTPFGHGTPFSQRQIRLTLNEAMFHVERSVTALYPPPFPAVQKRRLGEAVERAGRVMLPSLGGVVVVEAVKDMCSGVPLTVPNARLAVGRRILEPG